MERKIVSRPTPLTCEPITSNKELSDCWIAGRSLAELQAACLQRVVSTPLSVYVRSDAWVPCVFLSELAADGVASAFVDEDGEVLAWTGGTIDGPSSTSRTVVPPKECFQIKYPWHILAINEYVVSKLEENLIEGEICDGVHYEGLIQVGEGTRLLPGVFIEGNAIIGKNCKIGPNCYIRGNTAIGDGCHIGQSVEIKNSLIMPGAAVGHLSYCGDSIVGVKSNFGAGTITANFRHDGSNHCSMVGAVLMDTGRRKLGALIGDDVHTGIHTSIYPGRKIWPGLSTRPGDVVQRDLKP